MSDETPIEVDLTLYVREALTPISDELKARAGRGDDDVAIMAALEKAIVAGVHVGAVDLIARLTRYDIRCPHCGEQHGFEVFALAKPAPIPDRWEELYGETDGQDA
jgi:hypothetical protein